VPHPHPEPELADRRRVHRSGALGPGPGDPLRVRIRCAVTTKVPPPAAARAQRPRTEAAQRLPVPVLVVAVGAVGLLVLPLAGLFPRVDWPHFLEAITAPEALFALGLSLRTGAIAVVCCLVLGIPLALVLARARPTVAAVLRTLVTLPLVLPPLVGGLARLCLFGRPGGLGGVLVAA